MQKPKKKPVQEVEKPVLTGVWNGKDAWRMGLKLCMSLLGVTVAYFVLGLMLSFDSVWLRALSGLVLVSAAASVLYSSGAGKGQADAAFAEIMYQRTQEGKMVAEEERQRCFHPAKGLFAAIVGVAPYFLIALVFALLTQRQYYTLSALPNWLTGLMRQSNFGDGLNYYATDNGLSAMAILRILVRAMTMPFINVSVQIGDVAALWCERLSPLWVLVAPLGYALGYRQGLALRKRINTGIAIGDQKKKRRERRERRQRAASKAPERLI